jgi:hypothetical protein
LNGRIVVGDRAGRALRGNPAENEIGDAEPAAGRPD